MRSKIDMLKELGARHSLLFAGLALAPYSLLLLAVLAITQPAETGNAVASLVVSAAEASEGMPTIEPGTPVWSERTVYFPEAFPPVAGEVATPIDQF